MYERYVANVLMQRGKNTNIHYDTYKKSALCIVKHWFTIIIREGRQYHCTQVAPNWRN